MRRIRFSVLQILAVVLLAALTLSLIMVRARSKSMVDAIRIELANSRVHLRTVEYGNAILRLLELNPAIPDNDECLLFLRHELAMSILHHWKYESEIDTVVKRPGYVKSFVSRALPHLDCSSASEFVEVATTSLWIYTGDTLHATAKEMGEQELEAFDAFLRSALETENASRGSD